jgi:hypothetical protein
LWRRARNTRRHFLAAALASQGWQPLAASLLAQLIAAARQAAIAAGTGPVPARIVRALNGYFAPDLIALVRWSTGSTALSLPTLTLQYGDVLAITLIDVVLFRSADDAQWNEKLWAHELTHVMQYRRWGLDGFAARYIADANAVEREAYRNADRFDAWRHR